METEKIKVIENMQIINEAPKNTAKIACCGGVPGSNEDACCKLDEDKKAEGKSGCGCNTTANHSARSGCC